MPELAGVVLTPRTSALAGVRHAWIWLPMHEGAGMTLQDRAGQIGANGGGRTSPIFADSLLPLAGSPLGQEWRQDPSGLTCQGSLSARVETNPDLAAFLDLSSLVASRGTMLIAFNFRQVANPPTSQWLLDAATDGGGLGILVSTRRRIGAVYMAADSSVLNWIATTPATGPGALSDGRSHAVCFVFDFGVDLGACTLYVDGTASATDGVMLHHGSPPPPHGGKAIGIFGSAGGQGLLGRGANAPYATVSNLVVVRSPQGMAYGRIAQFVLDQAMFRHEVSTAIL